MNEEIHKTQLMLGVHEEEEADVAFEYVNNRFAPLSISEARLLADTYAKLCGVQAMQARILNILEERNDSDSIG